MRKFEWPLTLAMLVNRPYVSKWALNCWQLFRKLFVKRGQQFRANSAHKGCTVGLDSLHAPKHHVKMSRSSSESSISTSLEGLRHRLETVESLLRSALTTIGEIVNSNQNPEEMRVVLDRIGPLFSQARRILRSRNRLMSRIITLMEMSASESVSPSEPDVPRVSNRPENLQPSIDSHYESSSESENSFSWSNSENRLQTTASRISSDHLESDCNSAFTPSSSESECPSNVSENEDTNESEAWIQQQLIEEYPLLSHCINLKVLRLL